MDLATAVQGLTDVMITVFAPPASETLAEVWALGFVTPMAAGLGAWAVKAILGMFHH